MATFGQEPTAPAGHFYGPLVSGAWTSKAPVPIHLPVPQVLARTLVPPQSTTSPCSVPLLQAQIPKDVDFKIRQIAPPTDRVVAMPLANVPAPSCDSQR